MNKKGEQNAAITMKVTVPRGHSGFWQIMRELDECGAWSINDVADRTNDRRDNIADFVKRLIAGGYASQSGMNSKGHKQYVLLKKPRDTPRLRRDGSECEELINATLWRSIRMAKVFTASEIAEYSAIKRSTAKRYFQELARVSILAIDKKGEPAEETRYRLIKDIGAQAPQILRADAVFDPNSATVLGEAEAKEVQP